MKKMLLLFLATAASSSLLAQGLLPPLIQWQQTFGGTDMEELQCLQQTSDGGYILAGSSRSPASGNKTSPLIGFQDGWVVRLDAAGQKLWDLSFGGPRGDGFTGVQQLADEGFLLAGFYGSPVGPGTNAGSSIHSQPDFWVVRLDAHGSRLWERVYGGSGFDVLHDARQTPEGGFVLCGYSDSPAGGSKSSPLYGGNDGWVVRLDPHGNKLWDQSIGGTNGDYLMSVRPMADGGFVLGGESHSPPSGNKTGALIGGADFWMVRLDAHGNRLSDRTYGSTNSEYFSGLESTADGGWILGGTYSFVVTNLGSSLIGSSDFLAMRLDAAGDPLWTRAVGGTDVDRLLSLQQTADGGFILAGTTISSLFGRRSEDCWVVRLDGHGNPLWNQTYGGVLREEGQCIRLTADGGYALGVTSGSAPGGNKTSPLFGSWDFWVIKLGLEIMDSDGDGVPDPLDLCPDTVPGALVDEWGCSADQRDSDSDGVVDSHDLCPETLPGEIVNAGGCSLEQLVPCDGPWANHGQYLQAMQDVTARFMEAGLISPADRHRLLVAAAQSDCGKKGGGK